MRDQKLTETRAKSSRLYAAANLYANSLYSIAGETFGWEAGWKPADRETGTRAKLTRVRLARIRSTPPPKLAGSDEHRFTTADLTNVSLINHAVKESLSAFELSCSYLAEMVPSMPLPSTCGTTRRPWQPRDASR